MDGKLRRKDGVLLALFVLVVVSACSLFPPQLADPQGWSEDDQTFFYYSTQGSRLIWRDWFLALERHDNTQLFLADGLQRFGYLPGQQVGLYNPDKLPIGFALDQDAAGRGWIGMTCAACHTSEVIYGATTKRIDGAPASADMYEFLAKLDLALQKVMTNAPAFDRFAARVLGANDTPANRVTLTNEFTAFSEYFKQFMIDSTPTAPLQWGPARLDAFGMIFNRVTNIDLRRPTNNRPPNAPVSYPFLWGTSWHKWTQWNGAIENNGTVLGSTRRLGRNVGQVLGVFGTVDFTQSPTYPSSARRVNLEILESLVAKLVAPEWPAEFPALDAARVARGKDLYVSKGCINCHALVPRTPANAPGQNVQVVPLSIVQTDPAMTTMAATRTAETGILQGRRKKIFPILGNETLGANEKASDILGHAVLGVMFDGIFNPAQVSTLSTAFDLFNPAGVAAMTYKARPLNGIWATGPYLHNGSVRTLYQLLLLPAQRQVSFYVGSRKFDPVEVGFADEPGVIPFQLDTTRPGNRNIGHPFGAGLTNPERWDLVEYLKSL